MHGPPGLVEHEVAAAQRARFRGLFVLARIPVQVTSVYRVTSFYGPGGVVPAHPRGTRVRRRSWRHEGLSGRTHQWVGAAVGVTTGVAPVPVAALPPTAAVLSGVNRTS